MKKIIAIAFSLLAALSLMSCGNEAAFDTEDSAKPEKIFDFNSPENHEWLVSTLKESLEEYVDKDLEQIEVTVYTNNLDKKVTSISEVLALTDESEGVHYIIDCGQD